MTVWLNVSFTAQWVGPVVGIARTERRIAEELNETLKDQLQLCVWRNDEFVSFDKNSYFYPGIFTAPNQEKLTLTKWQKRRKKWKHSISKTGIQNRLRQNFVSENFNSSSKSK